MAVDSNKIESVFGNRTLSPSRLESRESKREPASKRELATVYSTGSGQFDDNEAKLPLSDDVHRCSR